MKKNTSKILAFILAALLLFALVGCGGEAAPSEAPETSDSNGAPVDTDDNGEGKTYNFAFVMKTMNNPYFVSMEEGVKEAIEAAKAEGKTVNVSVQGPEKETESEKMVQMCENAIASQVDVLIMTPSDSQAVVPVIKQANDANIPVITVDSRVDMDLLEQEGGKVVTFIGSDNYAGGKIAGETMVELFKDEEGEVEVAVLEGITGHETANNRKGGFEDGVEGSNLKIVASQPADWDQAKGYDVFSNMLTANPDIKGVFASNDMMGLGAMEAIENAGRTGTITLIGFDAQDLALEAVEAGTMYGTVAQYPVEMGKVAVEVAIKVIDDPSATFDAEMPTKVELITKEML
ncbi:MAG: sugar ABC transporter substrate-binding protein [Christensenellales bacterium]|jgi:ribose transport system substrate-binding protein